MQTAVNASGVTELSISFSPQQYHSKLTYCIHVCNWIRDHLLFPFFTLLCETRVEFVQKIHLYLA